MNDHRTTVNNAKDAKYYASTQRKTKAINVNPRNQRGGIRL